MCQAGKLISSNWDHTFPPLESIQPQRGFWGAVGIPHQSVPFQFDVSLRARCATTVRREDSKGLEKKLQLWESILTRAPSSIVVISTAISSIQNTKVQHPLHPKNCVLDLSCLIATSLNPSEVIEFANVTAKHSWCLQSLSSRDSNKTKCQIQTCALTRALQWHDAAASITPIHQCWCFSARSPNKYTASSQAVLAIPTPEVQPQPHPSFLHRLHPPRAQ
jgi:hypothetical protein